MTSEIQKLTPNPADGKPYKATIVTRDDRGQLVGVRVLRARTEEELDVKLRGFNARDDIARER